MQWASSIASNPVLSTAIKTAAEDIRRQLGGQEPDLVLVFVSSRFSSFYDQLPALVSEHLPARHVAGCSAGGVIGGGLELEGLAAVSLVAARLPEVEVRALHLETDVLPDSDSGPEVWRSWLGMDAVTDAHFILLADPFSVSMEGLLSGLDFAFPRGAKIGGLASGGAMPGENALFLDGQSYRRGLVTLALRGNIKVDTIVAQGCRPVGVPLTITQCKGNLLMKVDDQPPLAYLGELIASMNDADRELMRNSLFLGLQLDPFQENPRPGDFLIRNLVGIDYVNGVIAVGALLTEGQTVQFHLRDKTTSSEDLEQMLSRYAAGALPGSASGALMFSCVGRGRYLYGEPHHDTRIFQRFVQDVPLGGFFCNGEIGPVGANSHVHGYTSSFGIFRPAEEPRGE